MFDEVDLVHSYTRAQAFADGMLIALPEKLVKEAGIKFPVALTAGLWAELDPTEAEQRVLGQSIEGRLLDLLAVFQARARACSSDRMTFGIIVQRVTGQDHLEVLSACGLGDDMNPAITLCLPGEG